MENKFAQQLTSLRQSKKLSQEDLASQLYVSRQTVSKWENGSSTPDLEKLIQLATTLNVGLDQLVSGDTNTESSKTVTHNQPNQAMNGWEFLTRYWWVFIALIAVLGGVIPQIIHAFK